MLHWFGGISSGLFSIYSSIVRLFSWYYLLLCGGVLLWFIAYRFPYTFSPFIFVFVLWVALMGSFTSLVSCRLNHGVCSFFSGFVPVGTPLWICPLVCLAETISYLIRPFVLMLRPFINIGLGCVGAAVLGGFSVSSTSLVWVLGLVFFYELFVALVHWFIVTSILSFSVDH
uniref:ATP synthase F0 subunit 6 n=1 Tax=Caryophyllaeus brachycollis TaxID=1157996 RepID=A0A342K6E0_9CEST|nr:ATP synthase F0 subunit 6 [Caryophyllaeus brachycollis]AMA34315.1 ATP synthase F0 subunit 6 [Caryophyllaeus brachycollis]